MERVTRSQMQSLMQDTPKLVVADIRPTAAFHRAHMISAINIPLDERFDDCVRQMLPDKSAPVAVYGDHGADGTSHTAGGRLEQLGYRAVYDYEAGLADWTQAGLPLDDGRAGPP